MHSGPVILNNTPLVAFWVLNRLDLLQSMYYKIYIPKAVFEEFIAIDETVRRQSLARSPWIEVLPLQAPAYALTFVGLDAGEAEVLALALERSARLVIMDERKGRTYAQRLSLPLTGTVGVLLAAKSRGFINAVSPMIDTLLKNDFYLNAALIHRVLQTAGEASHNQG